MTIDPKLKDDVDARFDLADRIIQEDQRFEELMADRIYLGALGEIITKFHTLDLPTLVRGLTCIFLASLDTHSARHTANALLNDWLPEDSDE